MAYLARVTMPGITSGLGGIEFAAWLPYFTNLALLKLIGQINLADFGLYGLEKRFFEFHFLIKPFFLSALSSWLLNPFSVKAISIASPAVLGTIIA